MLKIIKTDGDTIKYSCDCGVQGECIFRPRSGSLIMVLDITCPICNDKKRLKIMQYDTEEERIRLGKDNNDVDYYWPIIIDNNIT
jgi:hypothetical protein